MLTKAIEIIDLTKDDSPGFPPSSAMPSSNLNTPAIPSFGDVASTNHNLHPMIHPHQTAQWQAPPTFDPSQVGTRFYTGIHVGQVRSVLELVPESTIFFFPTAVGLREPWSQREHEFVSFNLNLINFFVSIIPFLFYVDRFHFHFRWSEISRHFVCSKTPQQVQSYAASFFGHQAATYVRDFMRRNPPIGYYFVSNGNHMSRNRNLIDTSASYSIAMTVANEAQLETLTLFQKNATFSQVPPCGGESSSNNITHGDGPSTSAIATNDVEIDLELRLG